MDERDSRMRVGDQERAAVAERLSQAHADGRLTLEEFEERQARCWQARTMGDLAVLVADLPQPPPVSLPQRVRERPAPVQRGVSGLVRGGALAVAAAAALGLVVLPVVTADDGASVFGSRVVQVGPEQTDVEVGMLFGSVTVVVPDDARVTSAGFIVFGSLQCDSACDGSGSRAVTVDATGAFGSVEVVRAGETDD